MKVVQIKVAGSYREPLILELSPGMTIADIMAEADLDNYVLSRQGDDKYLQPGEELFDMLADCETLYASQQICEVY